MPIELKFCGAAGVVTGSSYLLKVPGGQFLIDCGPFQGAKVFRRFLWIE
jgi:metallo-beta-lactamase family protein